MNFRMTCINKALHWILCRGRERQIQFLHLERFGLIEEPTNT